MQTSPLISMLFLKKLYTFLVHRQFVFSLTFHGIVSLWSHSLYIHTPAEKNIKTINFLPHNQVLHGAFRAHKQDTSWWLNYYFFINIIIIAVERRVLSRSQFFFSVVNIQERFTAQLRPFDELPLSEYVQIAQLRINENGFIYIDNALEKSGI